jgi:hypothetical protein
MEKKSEDRNSKPKESGRCCKGHYCNSRILPWKKFALKPNGLNGRDSRCKKCVAKQKRLMRSEQRKNRRFPDSFTPVIIGSLGEEGREQFSKILAQSIIDLLEQGQLK